MTSSALQQNDRILDLPPHAGRRLSEFQSFCRDNDIEVTVQRLFELSQPLTGRRYGLTEKQEAALMATWEAGYFHTDCCDYFQPVSTDRVHLELTPETCDGMAVKSHSSPYQSPPSTTLTEIATDLGITRQSLSNRLRRGHQALVANTLTIQGPSGA